MLYEKRTTTVWPFYFNNLAPLPERVRTLESHMAMTPTPEVANLIRDALEAVEGL